MPPRPARLSTNQGLLLRVVCENLAKPATDCGTDALNGGGEVRVVRLDGGATRFAVHYGPGGTCASLDTARRRVSEWTAWTARQNLVVRAAVVLAIVALVLGVFWVLFALSGVPGWLPDAVETPLTTHVPGL